MNAKVVHRNSKRFLNIGLLKNSTPVLGSTADTWDRAIKGNMAANLEGVQRRVMASAVSAGTLAKR